MRLMTIYSRMYTMMAMYCGVEDRAQRSGPCLDTLPLRAKGPSVPKGKAATIGYHGNFLGA
jgi:hypothetical protein